MNHIRTALLLVVVSAIAFIPEAHAQWPTDPALNLTLANGDGEQTTPIIRETSDGGAFILFYSNASGNYDVYLQYVNAAGAVQWENGLLVSDNPMTSWITVWDMEVDVNDNAIFATNDIRDGDDWDIYAYSVSTDGTFNWGEDGVTLTANAIGDVGQQAVGTSDGGAVFAWQDDNSVVNLTKLDADGNSAWDPAVITITDEFPVDRIKLASTDDGGVIAGYQVHTSDFWMSPSYYVGQRYSADGTPQWGDGGVQANPNGDISTFTQPDILSDGANGAIFYWYNNNNHAFVQHVDASGSVLWNDASAVQASLAADQLQTSPDIAYDMASGITYIFYTISNANQSLWGVGGQAVSANGARLWGDNAVELVALGQNQASHVSATFVPGYGAVATYLIDAGGQADHLEGIMLDASGEPVWDTSPVVMSSVSSEKGRQNAVLNNAGQVLSVFTDNRSGNPDLYLQNINPDGSLGAWGGAGPSLAIDWPNEGDVINSLPISMNYSASNFNIAEEGGDGILAVTVSGTSTEYGFTTFDGSVVIETLEVGENTITLELVDYDENPLDPPVTAEVTVTYVLPTLDITSPEDGSEVDVDQVTVQFDITHFELGAEGDGYLEFSMNEGDPQYLDSSEDLLVENLLEGENTLTFQLVDLENQPLDPAVLASVTVSYIVNAVGDGAAAPNEYALAKSWPNPFNPSTSIRFTMKASGTVRLAVYDMLGREVAVLTDGVREAGVHNLSWHAVNQPSGVYFLRMTTGSGFSATEKLVRLK
ncbi:T9SS type A sorting domain-containing protein [bacterium]|nr:T9SS type A sorting domain-containing protein [bacterium]